MTEYHKIHTIYKRDMESPGKRLLVGEWSHPEFEYLQHNTWVFTEKVDGANIRVMFDGTSLTFGGRTENSSMPANLVTALNKQFLPQLDMFRELFPECTDVCLYGEGYGAKIQKGGGNYRSDQGFVLFDVKVGGWWLRRKDVEAIACTLGIDVVPIIGEGTLHDAVELARQGIVSTWGNFQAEGIVARPKTELKTRGGQRIIAKIKCRDFAHG